ncbi:MAG: cytochrome c maturation protein CcmE [Syntrophothermus sp.]
MNKKYIFGGVIIVVFLILMVSMFTQSSIKYETNFQNVMSNNKTFKAAGFWVKEKSFVQDNAARTFSFVMKDEKGTEMKVVYTGSIPNNFESAQSLVVTGKYENGTFHAKDILTKCPSKYEQEKQKVSSL